jgi:hypothetical protein
MAEAREKLTAGNWGATTRTLTTTSLWARPRSVIAERTGDSAATTSLGPKAFAVVVGTAPSTNQVEFTAPNKLTFGTGFVGTTTYSMVNVYGIPRGSGSAVA